MIQKNKSAFCILTSLTHFFLCLGDWRLLQLDFLHRVWLFVVLTIFSTLLWFLPLCQLPLPPPHSNPPLQIPQLLSWDSFKKRLWLKDLPIQFLTTPENLLLKAFYWHHGKIQCYQFMGLLLYQPRIILQEKKYRLQKKNRSNKSHMYFFLQPMLCFFFFFLTGQQDVGINVLPPTDPQLMFNS